MFLTPDSVEAIRRAIDAKLGMNYAQRNPLLLAEAIKAESICRAATVIAESLALLAGAQMLAPNGSGCEDV